MDNEKDARLASVFGNIRGISAPAVSTAAGRAEEPGYGRMQKDILEYFDRNAEPSPLREWVGNGMPLSVCFVAKSLEQPLGDMLVKRLVPFISLKKPVYTAFIVRESDGPRLSKSLYDTVRIAQDYAEILNYPQFREQVAEESGAFYIKNLSEIQMEFLRRLYERHGGNRKYAIFRMDGSKWGMGFPARDMLASPLHDGEKTCVLEDLLLADIVLSGHLAEEAIAGLADDILVDRMKSNNFNYALQKNGSVYIFSPDFPKHAVKIVPGKFQSINVRNDNGAFSLKETAFMALPGKAGNGLLQKELKNMGRKKAAYTQQEFLSYVSYWYGRDRRKEKETRKIRECQKILASMAYRHFAMLNKDEPWFKNFSRPCEQALRFKQYLEEFFDSVRQREIPRNFPECDAEKLYRAADGCRMTPDAADRVKKNFLGLQIGDIGNAPERAPLREMLGNAGREGGFRPGAEKGEWLFE